MEVQDHWKMVFGENPIFLIVFGLLGKWSNQTVAIRGVGWAPNAVYVDVLISGLKVTSWCTLSKTNIAME